MNSMVLNLIEQIRNSYFIRGGPFMGDSQERLALDSYAERWSPWFLPLVFWLPCFWRYEVVVGGGRLTFG